MVAYLRTLARYAHCFSWAQLFLFKLSDILVHWAAHPSMRRVRALRVFAYAVPLDTVVVRDGEYRFPYVLNDTRIDLALRAHSSDVEVFLQVIRYAEYADVTRMLRAGAPPPRIIDAGANIGLTTLYFKCFHPDARVAALEPEPENFKRLSQTVLRNGLKDVTLLKEGLWTHDSHLAPDRTFRDGQAWSFALAPSSTSAEDGVPVVSLASLLSRLGWRRVDLLKIDIEGAEAHLIRDPSFLSVVRECVGLVCMEVHEEAIGRDEVHAALASIGMSSVGGKESVIAWRAS